MSRICICIFLLILTCSILYAQEENKVFKLRAYEQTIMPKINGDWAKEETTKSNILIVIDINEGKDRITFYDANPDTYDIINATGPKTDYRGNTTTNFTCIDRYGIVCQLAYSQLRDGARIVILLYPDFLRTFRVNLI